MLILFCSGYSSCRVSIKCSYAEAGVKEDSNSATIDVMADIKTERVCSWDFFLKTFLFYDVSCNYAIFRTRHH